MIICFYRFLKYIPLSIVLANTLASLLIGVSVTFYRDKPPNLNPNSWLSALKFKTRGYKLNSPFHVHIYALLWMSGCATSIGTSLMTAQSAIEMIFTVASIVSGKLIYGWFLDHKIWNPLAYVADRLKKLRGSGQLYLVNVNIVLM